MPKLKLKKSAIKGFIILGIIIAILICIPIGKNIYKDVKYKQTLEYKLISRGYTKKEAILFQNKMAKKDVQKLLVNAKNNKLKNFVQEKYYLAKNHKLYLNYKKEHENISYSDTIAIINVFANNEWYDEDTITKTDTSKKELMLVNKFHYLTQEYAPTDIVTINSSYAYANNQVLPVVNEAYQNMWHEAKEKGITLIASSSYRTYDEQQILYRNYTAQYGQRKADEKSARPGFSEHQTGYTMDILTYKATTENFETTDAFKWLNDNAYKFGFILRYPKDKTYLTGYAYESWHYRYVGVETATKINDLKITFDEYYAFYLDK